jgi:transcriptional regulator with XRE-family HTH domain
VAKHYLHLSKILKKLLYERRMNASELAREVNLPCPTIHRLVTGKSTRPYRSSLIPIADYFSLNVNQLIDEEPLSGNDTSFKESSTQSLPLLKWDMSKDENNKDLIISSGLSSKCFALIMPDESMEPLFPRGSILIFDPELLPKDRSYALISLQNTNIIIFRQILIDVNQQYIKPLNLDFSSFKMKILDTNDKILATLCESRCNYISS